MAYTTIDDPEAYFQTQLYTGNGAANHAITFDDTDTDMQPDFVWIKNRDAADSHCLFDTARGATKLIDCATNALETTDTDTLDSFTSDGFQVDADVKVNTDTENYVAWCWKGGTTSGITTNGSTDVTPSAYSFDQTSKFSALKYAGNGNTDNQVAHGIGTAPDLMMVKNLDGSINSWAVFHKSTGNEKYLELDVSNALADGINRWQDTDPDTVNFTTGNSDTVNNSSYNYICYAWSEVQGFSKFGAFTGNGNADGTFAYCGFKPAFVMIKGLHAASWFVYDNKRPGYNPGHAMYADGADTENTGSAIYMDLLSNGFKMRTATDPNAAQSYVFFAWAEAPFVNSNGVPCNAR